MKFLITGANQGLGYYTAEILCVAPGNQVFITSRDSSKGEAAAAELKKTTHSTSTVGLVHLDITDDESISKAALLPDLQELDCLINNGGVAFLKETSTRKMMMEVYNVNVFGTAVVTEKFLPALSKSKHRPAIINVSSGLGSIDRRMKNFTPNSDSKGPTNLIAYNTSKTALNGLSAFFANENPKMRVVCVAPGHCATNLNNHAAPNPPQSGARIIANAAMDEEGETGIFVGVDGKIPW